MRRGGREPMPEHLAIRRAGAPSWLRDIPQDLRYAARTLRKRRASRPIAVLTLGLGIGATTAIYSVVETILLRPLPFADSDRLVRVVENMPPRRARPPVVSARPDLAGIPRLARADDDAVGLIGTAPSIGMVKTRQGTARLWGGWSPARRSRCSARAPCSGARCSRATITNPDVVVLTYDDVARTVPVVAGHRRQDRAEFLIRRRRPADDRRRRHAAPISSFPTEHARVLHAVHARATPIWKKCSLDHADRPSACRT